MIVAFTFAGGLLTGVLICVVAAVAVTQLVAEPAELTAADIDRITGEADERE